MTHPKRRPIYNLFISTIFISLVASCSFIPVTEPTAPIGIFPTPTSITDIYKTEEFDNSPALIPDEFKPILRATVPPFDLDAVAEAEEAAELALEEELRQTSISIQINATTSTHTISPLIYGVANGSEAYIKELDIPLNSWGGGGRQQSL